MSGTARVMGADDLFPPKPAKPTKAPARKRVIRCEKCRSYLFDVDLLRCDPGTQACVLVSLRCRNNRCRKPNQVTIDLVNEDPPEQNGKEPPRAQNPSSLRG